jgi:hypothetical protein
MTKQFQGRGAPAAKSSTRKRRLTKTQAQAKIAEAQQLAVEVVARPDFASLKAAKPITAMLWTVLAERAQQEGAAATPTKAEDD